MPTTTINLTGQALSKVDDTNVTLTLTGTPLTALLKATSITVGWTGTLADARIASAATWNAKENALTFSTGLTRTVNTITIDSTVVTLTGTQALSNKTGLISQWTNDSGYLTSAVTAVTGSGNIASSGGATPNITFTGVLPTANGGTAVNIASSALVLGTASANAGQLTLSNATNAFTQTIRGTNPAASITYDLPTTAPTLGQVLSATAPAAGIVTLSWATAAGGITINSTAITGGGANRILFENSSNQVSESATEFYFQTASPYAHVYAGGRTGVITGLDNTFFGREAGKLITTGLRNTFIGSNVGASSTSSTSSSTLIGFLAGGNNPGSGVVAVGVTTGGNNSTGSGVAVGNEAVIGNGTSQTVLGPNASTLGSSGNSTALGSGSLASGTYGALALGSNCTASVSSGIAIGYSVSATHAYSIAIGGYGTATSAANQLMIGSSDATLGGTNGISEVCIGNGNTATSARSVTIRITSGSGTNNAGGSLTKTAGKGTGTAASGNNVEQTSVKGASGTTLQSLTDRHNIIGKYVDITESAATTYGTLALTTSGTIAGGTIIYTIEANDGTDYQSLTGNAVYSVVNKAGTLTVTLTDLTQALAESAGGSTLTSTMTATVSGTSVLFQANAVSSLVQTTLRISFQVLNNFGPAIVTPA